MLREILVISLVEHSGLGKFGSKLDEKLRKAASIACANKEAGQHDIFAFLVLEGEQFAETRHTLLQLGYSDDQLVTLPVDRDATDSDNWETYRENAASVLSSWLDKEHSSAIEITYKDSHGDLDLWWSGIESTKAGNSWPFSETEFGRLLPGAHERKGSTWLAILQKAMELDEPVNWADENRLSVLAACLCEWLHGFEGASGNSYNYFEPATVCDALNISDLWVGLCFREAHSDRTVDEILAEYDSEESLSEIKTSVLLDATEEIRSEMRDALAQFFGGDGALFYVLYSAIWRSHDRPCGERLEELLGDADIDHLAEIDEPWRFVQDGWSDGACHDL